MNTWVLFAFIIVLFYLVYCFYETGFTRYHSDIQMVTHYSISTALCCMGTFLLSSSLLYVLFYAILLLYPIIIYYKQQGFFKRYLHWCLLIALSFLFLITLRYFASILPERNYQFHFYFDLLQLNALAFFMLLYFQWTKTVKEAIYTAVVSVGLVFIFLLNLVYFYDAVNAMESFGLLFPMVLMLCFLILFRCAYAMDLSAENVLKLTVKRYTEKENKEKYESLEKENKLIMQQLHDMKKHLQILDEMEEHEEDTKTYQQEIVAKAEELLYTKQSGVPIIDRILQTYRPRFQEAHIQCNIEVDDIDFHFMSTIDLSAMLANLLDNAVESCLKCEERFLLLKIKKQRDIIILKMKNSCMLIEEEKGELKTTKSDLVFHGYGMRNIDMIARKYQGKLTYHFDEEYHIFITTISLFPDRS